MKITDIVNRVLVALNWKYEDTARKKHGSFPGWTKGELLTLILTYETGAAVASAKGVGIQAFNRTVKDILVPIVGSPSGGSDNWKLKLLNIASLKTCANCKVILEHSCFTKYSATYDGLDRICCECKKIKNALHYKTNKDTYHKPYIEAHRSEYNARNANRRAKRIASTPSWANMDLIKKVYDCCPEGCHVDHKVPLQGDNVCGLHVENNLQYLTSEENLCKSNKLLEEFVHSNWT